MSELSLIAQPYAQAAFEFAYSKNAVELWGSWLESAAQISSHKPMVSLLGNPLTSRYAVKLFQELCQTEKDIYRYNFLQLLATNNRLNVLPAIYQQFSRLQQAKANQVTIEIVSAQPLSLQQQQKLSQALTRRVTGQIILQCRVDTSLLAGLTIRIGDRMLDYSIQGRLKRLAQQLQA